MRTIVFVYLWSLKWIVIQYGCVNSSRFTLSNICLVVGGETPNYVKKALWIIPTTLASTRLKILSRLIVKFGDWGVYGTTLSEKLTPVISWSNLQSQQPRRLTLWSALLDHLAEQAVTLVQHPTYHSLVLRLLLLHTVFLCGSWTRGKGGSIFTI